MDKNDVRWCLICRKPVSPTRVVAMPRSVDPVLIAEMLDRHGAALELYASQWTAAAEDCVQEALVELARQAAAPENPPAWLYRVVRNRALNHCRSEARRTAHEQVATRLRDREPELIDAFEMSDALAVLEPAQTEVVVLRIWGRLTWHEISEVTGRSPSAAGRDYQDALRELRRIWEIRPCATSSE